MLGVLDLLSREPSGQGPVGVLRREAALRIGRSIHELDIVQGSLARFDLIEADAVGQVESVVDVFDEEFPVLLPAEFALAVSDQDPVLLCYGLRDWSWSWSWSCER